MKEVRLGPSEVLRLDLAPDGYAAIDVDTRKRYDLDWLAARLRWRHSVVLPQEPRMPPHEYIVVANLGGRDLRYCRILEFIIDKHPETYAAYFRGYQYPIRYLDSGSAPNEYRYWRTRLNKTWFVNRCRMDSVEPPRRVDRGAKPIPAEEWGAKYPWWPQKSGYGSWKKDRNGVWRFRREPFPKIPR
jgi:hypothetical protein